MTRRPLASLLGLERVLRLSWALNLSTLLLSVMLSLPAAAQRDTVPKKRLRSPAAVSGFVGGEAHNSYVIRARRGQTLSAHLSGRRGRRTFAQLTVSQSPSFFNAEPVRFGRETEHGRSWRGRVPRTGDYYLYVTSHPDSRYTLRARVR
jgi:hypothetical protein